MRVVRLLGIRGLIRWLLLIGRLVRGLLIGRLLIRRLVALLLPVVGIVRLPVGRPLLLIPLVVIALLLVIGLGIFIWRLVGRAILLKRRAAAIAAVGGFPVFRSTEFTFHGITVQGGNSRPPIRQTETRPNLPSLSIDSIISQADNSFIVA